jgi:hypothetical protein
MAYAFEAHLDPDLVKQVMDKTWLPGPTQRVPHRPGSAQSK